MQQIRQNLERLYERISSACSRIGRNPKDITLVAVTKTFPVEIINQAVAVGVSIIGENRVQEALEKHPQIGPGVQWHLIGHLQSNKAKKAVEIFSLIHSVDSTGLAREIGRRAIETGKVQEILVEVNTSGESQKYGFQPEIVLDVLQEIKDMEGVKVLGLMTVGPLTDDAGQVRSSFRMLKKIYDQFKSQPIPNIKMKHLSMGMSGDFEIAIEEGSNMIRVGSAIFGNR